MEIETKEINPQVKRDYKRYYLIAGGLILAFLVGLQIGGQGTGDAGGAGKVFAEKNRDNAPISVDWNLLWTAISRVEEKYVDRPVDLQEVLYGAVRGAVSSLGDPYTAFLPPQEAEDFQNELNGNLEGIGAEIALKNERLTVVSPLDDSPAEAAGIKAGDFIFKVDGEETADFSLQEAVSKIRGPAGTAVNLTIFRPGEREPREFEIFREQIVVKSIETEIREAGEKKIGYIKMRRFGEDSGGILDSAVSNFLQNNVQGIVFDLRNNPGGFLETAADIASNWVEEGEAVVIQRFSDGSETALEARGPARLGGMPTVVIMNGGSASASEVVAGALRDHGKATLVGETSFGKGSVQELVGLQDGAELKITVAKWLTPGGHDLNETGLAPDVPVELSEEDFNADRDPQMEKALELLTR